MQPAIDSKHKALEMTMRDVIDCLEEAANYTAMTSMPGGLEILSIEAPSQSPLASGKKARVTKLFID